MDPEASGTNHGPKPSNAPWMILPPTLPHSRLEKMSMQLTGMSLIACYPLVALARINESVSCASKDPPGQSQPGARLLSSGGLWLSCIVSNDVECSFDLNWVLVNANSPKYWVVLRLTPCLKETQDTQAIPKTLPSHNPSYMSCRRASSVVTTWSSCTVRFSPTVFWLTHLSSQVHLCNRSFSTPNIDFLWIRKGCWAWPSSHVPSLSQLLDHIDCSREHDVERVACIALGDDLLSCCKSLPSNLRIVLSSPERTRPSLNSISMSACFESRKTGTISECVVTITLLLNICQDL